MVSCEGVMVAVMGGGAGCSCEGRGRVILPPCRSASSSPPWGSCEGVYKKGKVNRAEAGSYERRGNVAFPLTPLLTCCSRP